MSTRIFTEDHEWIVVDGDIATVGITDFAQEQLGDVVFVELPEIGKSFSRGDEAAVVESVKAAAEVYAPLTGDIVAVNDLLNDDPALVNTSPVDKGWFVKIRITDTGELEGLMDEAAYAEFAKGQG